MSNTSQSAMSNDSSSFINIILPLLLHTLQSDTLRGLVALINSDLVDAGYAVVIHSSHRTTASPYPTRAFIACNRHGAPRNTRNISPEQRKRPQRTSKRCGCPMRLKATFCLETKLWEFTCINNSHNHMGTTAASAHAV